MRKVLDISKVYLSPVTIRGDAAFVAMAVGVQWCRLYRLVIGPWLQLQQGIIFFTFYLY